MITDEYIEELFRGQHFGTEINSSISAKREFLKNEIRNQCKGYWSGSTSYDILINGGLIIDGPSGEKKITLLGEIFCDEN